MAIVKGLIQVTGSMGGYSFYTVRGSDRVIVRTKGGPNKKQMKHSPNFENARKSQKEFGACTKFGSKARHALGGLYRLADYNLHPALTSIGTKLMKLDVYSEKGKRSLKLSDYKQALVGFSLNRDFMFTSVVSVTPRWELDRENMKAVVTIPTINTELDLLNKQNFPFFRMMVVIGAVSDMVYNPGSDSYEPSVVELNGIAITWTGEWNSSQTILAEQTITVQIPESQKEYLTPNVSLLLSMGVEFGDVNFLGQPAEVKYAGCGKVMAVW